MDTGAIMQLISNGFFPCAMCLMLFWYIKDEQKTTREILTELDKSIVSLKDIIQEHYRSLNRSEEDTK